MTNAISVTFSAWAFSTVRGTHMQLFAYTRKQPFKVLWKFLRTVLRNPRLAALVRTLTIGNWGFYPHVTFGKPEKLGLSGEDLDLIHVAIVNAGIRSLEAGIIDD
ncbi:hypothetical protein BDV38DRAFT_286571 [Aspergillus pseudotamarii]|uniref:Uncharacterized protein n=1 Tax=Aspergillus pseudotamarii TaxID=132259 RepID=A0A5N6SKL7_ASPPS|nr:uncharacterized protein BDV38DRAFT_286571 [Aspergillus pseudotamarii]KAE8133674.1 hypothetical protein BDV38DRAFT_286571 [Aspergillus pseudotamarii]